MSDDVTIRDMYAGCTADPPAAPADGSTDWDGSSLAAGLVVTYSCPAAAEHGKAVCDAATLEWKPDTIAECGAR